jgi:hypothetical protein
MVVNFRACEISRDARKMTRTFTLIKKINNMSDIKSTLGLALESIETVVVKDMFLSCTSKIK